MFYRMTNGRQILPLVVTLFFISIGSLFAFQKGRVDSRVIAQPTHTTAQTIVRTITKRLNRV